MPAASTIVATTLSRTRALPPWVKYLATCALVATVMPLSMVLQGELPRCYPFLPFLFAFLLAGSLSYWRSWFVAMGLSALLAAWLFLAPAGSLLFDDPRDRGGLLLFVAVGASVAAVI